MFQRSRRVFVEVRLASGHGRLVPFLVSYVPTAMGAGYRGSTLFRGLGSTFRHSFTTIYSNHRQVISTKGVSRVGNSTKRNFFFYVGVRVLVELRGGLVVFQAIVSFRSLLHVFRYLLLGIGDRGPSSFSYGLTWRDHIVTVSRYYVSASISQRSLLPCGVLRMYDSLGVFRLGVLSGFSCDS